jgi:putative DNA primase/helicase
MYQATHSKIKKVKALVDQQGGWRNIFERYSGLKTAIDRYPAQTPCPKTGEGKTVFRLVNGWEQSGQAFHNQVGKLTDGLNVIAFYCNCSIKEAADDVLRITGGNYQEISYREVSAQIRREQKQQSEYCSEEKKGQRLKALQKVYLEAIPAYRSEIAMNYLRSRGLTLTSDDVHKFSSTLGFHPGLKYYCADKKRFIGTFPALLGIFKSKDGTNLSIHRIYLKPDGSGKAEVSNPKKLMSPPGYMGGGAFRLGEPITLKCGGKYIGVTEGIETALALFNANGLPCWSLYSDTVLALFEPDFDITHVGIWSEREPSGAGLLSAKKLMAKLSEKGVKCHIYYPEFLNAEKEDWLDVFNTNPTLIQGYTAR